MIEINLLEKKSTVQLPEIMGIDLAKFNILGLIIGTFLLYVPECTIHESWLSQQQEKRVENKNLKDQVNKLRKKVTSRGDVDKKIEAFKKQEEKLNQRLDAVKEIIKSRKSPLSLLRYISENIPEDVWVSEITFENGTLVVKGESTSYRSIGVFLTNLQNSVFFKSGNPVLAETNTVTNPSLKRRTEYFLISGAVTKYN